ncbi:hypothetical protein BH10ACT10_BH10ACT10_02220 [soil metagenome]
MNRSNSAARVAGPVTAGHDATEQRDAWRVVSVRLVGARRHLHARRFAPTLRHKRNSYRTLVCLTRALADVAAVGCPEVRRIHATPGQTVLLVPSAARGAVARELGEASRDLERWGLRFEVRDDGPSFPLDSLPGLRTGWLRAQADVVPKALARRVPKRAEAADRSIIELVEALGGQVGLALRHHWARFALPDTDSVAHADRPVGPADCSAGSTTVWDRPVADLLTDKSFGQVRIDVTGFRSALVSTARTTDELLARAQAAAEWFEQELPRLAAAQPSVDCSTEGLIVLHSVCDDAILVGHVPRLLRTVERLGASYQQAAHPGRLVFGLGRSTGCADLTDLAAAALADLTAAPRAASSGDTIRY